MLNFEETGYSERGREKNIGLRKYDATRKGKKIAVNQCQPTNYPRVQ